MKRAAMPVDESLTERIRRTEAAIVRRDTEFVRALDTITAELPRLARRAGTVLLVAAATTAVIALIRRRAPPAAARDGASADPPPAPAQRPAGTFALLSLLLSLLPLVLPAWPTGRPGAPGSGSLQRFVQRSWPLLQWWLDRSSRARAGRHAGPGGSRAAVRTKRDA